MHSMAASGRLCVLRYRARSSRSDHDGFFGRNKRTLGLLPFSKKGRISVGEILWMTANFSSGRSRSAAFDTFDTCVRAGPARPAVDRHRHAAAHSDPAGKSVGPRSDRGGAARTSPVEHGLARAHRHLIRLRSVLAERARQSDTVSSGERLGHTLLRGPWGNQAPHRAGKEQEEVARGGWKKACMLPMGTLIWHKERRKQSLDMKFIRCARAPCIRFLRSP